MYTGYLRPAGETDTIVSLTPSSLTCVSCKKPCQELLVVPKKAVGRGESGWYRIIRCLDRYYEDPFFVRFEGEPAVEILRARHFDKRGFIEDQCNPESKASIAWGGRKCAGESRLHADPGGRRSGLAAESRTSFLPEMPEADAVHPSTSSDSLDIHNRNKDLADPFNSSIEYYATLYFFVCEACQITCSETQWT